MNLLQCFLDVSYKLYYMHFNKKIVMENYIKRLVKDSNIVIIPESVLIFALSFLTFRTKKVAMKYIFWFVSSLLLVTSSKNTVT